MCAALRVWQTALIACPGSMAGLEGMEQVQMEETHLLAAGGLRNASKSHVVNEWVQPKWADLQLGKPDPPAWSFTILFVGVNNDKIPDLCLRDEHKKIQWMHILEWIMAWIMAGHRRSSRC